MSKTEIFRCPVDALDEFVPHLTLEQWARGDTDFQHDPDDPEDQAADGYGGFEPGDVVPFSATEEIAVITVEVENGLAVNVPLPAGTTRVAVQYDPENQAYTLGELDLSEYPGRADIVCLRDEVEYWRCTGAKADAEAGTPDTRSFEPATLLDWLDWFDRRYTGYGDDHKAARASLGSYELSRLIMPLRRALIAHPELNTGSPESRHPQLDLIASGEGGAA